MLLAAECGCQLRSRGSQIPTRGSGDEHHLRACAGQHTNERDGCVRECVRMHTRERCVCVCARARVRACVRACVNVSGWGGRVTGRVGGGVGEQDGQ